MSAHSGERKKKRRPRETKRLEFTLVDCYAFKTVMDILKVSRESIALRFSPKGLSIIEFGAGETSVQQYEFFADRMLYYNYPFDPVETPIWSIEVSPSEIFSVVKNECKREPVYIHILINPKTNKAREMYVSRSKSAIGMESLNHVVIQSTNPHLIEPIDYYKLSFADKPPTHKIYTTTFVKSFGTLKTRNCSVLSFEINPKGINLMNGKRNSCKVVSFRLPVEGLDMSETIDESDSDSDDDGSSSSEDEDDGGSSSSSESDDGDMLESMGMVLVDDDNYCINLNCNNIFWFLKLGRITQTSIIDIYLEEGQPLIMKSPMSFFGEATFSFNSDIK